MFLLCRLTIDVEAAQAQSDRQHDHVEELQSNPTISRTAWRTLTRRALVLRYTSFFLSLYYVYFMISIGHSTAMSKIHGSMIMSRDARTAGSPTCWHPRCALAHKRSPVVQTCDLSYYPTTPYHHTTFQTVDMEHTVGESPTVDQ
jgi:hypothetical protein